MEAEARPAAAAVALAEGLFGGEGARRHDVGLRVQLVRPRERGRAREEQRDARAAQQRQHDLGAARVAALDRVRLVRQHRRVAAERARLARLAPAAQPLVREDERGRVAVERFLARVDDLHAPPVGEGVGQPPLQLGAPCVLDR